MVDNFFIFAGVCSVIFFALQATLPRRNRDWALIISLSVFFVLVFNLVPGLSTMFGTSQQAVPVVGLSASSVTTTVSTVSKETPTFSGPPVDQSWNQLFVIMALVVVFIILIAAYFYWLHYVKKKKSLQQSIVRLKKVKKH